VADPTRVLCVDDDDSTVRFYQLAIDAENDLACVGTRTDLAGLRAELESSRAEILLLDLTIPGWDTLAELAQIKRDLPALKTLIVSGFDDDARIARAFAHGADGYVVKSLRLQDVIDALRRTARGERVVPRGHAEPGSGVH
jgi:DNA-binding NarL/FixJ family response regulator